MHNKVDFHVTKENLKKENDILEKIERYVDKKTSILFDSGAGSGKTYTLIETLKYILFKYGIELEKYNQKIVCITFTNVAALEVEERLGKSSLIQVSTIHAWIWDVIKIYQKEIFEIHMDEIETKVKEYEDKIDVAFNNPKFIDLLQKSKEEYYLYKDLSAKNFKEKFGGHIGEFKKLLSNVTIFRENSNNILKKLKLEEALLRKGEEKITVLYNSKINYDRLEKMEFSHDTLLNYAYKLVSKYKNFKKILINKFPYILIDEYQDTSKYVLNLINSLDEYSSKIDRKIFVGYYGDEKQDIYSTNSDIKELLTESEKVIKSFNRRSANNIINVANKIRNDNIEQESIFHNMIDGEINFFTGIDRDLCLDFFKKKWGINTSNKLHCLELTNEGVSKGNGFIKIYDFFKNTPYYKIRFKQISLEVLNSDITKLGKVPLILFKILDFLEKIKNQKSMVIDVVPKSYLENSKNILTYKKLYAFVETFQKINGDTLLEYISNLFSIIEELDSLKIENILDEPFTNIEELKEYIFDKLYTKEDNECNKDIGLSDINNFLNLDINIFKSWYSYIKAETNKDIIYHTYHGTKGLEFDNVIIFMENKFNRKKNFFTNFFKDYHDLNDQYCLPQNLLYVAITRAKKNLAILFLDELLEDNIILNIENIFGKINKTLT